MLRTIEKLHDGIKELESLIADYEEYLTQLHEDGYIDIVADGREYLISLED